MAPAAGIVASASSWPIPRAQLLTVFLVAMLAGVHILPEELPNRVRLPRQTTLSAAGGVSTAFGFLYLLPELVARSAAIADIEAGSYALAEHHVFAVAFLGIAVFYGLERLALVARSVETRVVPRYPIFWVHIAGFAIYNAFIGYALVAGEAGADADAVVFAVAMAVHLFGNDEAMDKHHPGLYKRYGQWVLMGAVVLGAALGTVLTMRASVFTILLGLLTGGLIFNAIKDELPQTRKSQYWAFFAGALGFALVLMIL